MGQPRRGEIYRLKPLPPLGKPRPVLVISRDELNLGHSVVAVPFYSQQLAKRTSQKWCVFFYKGEGGLEVDCVAKTDEVSLIDKLHLNLAAGPIGTFDTHQLSRVTAALTWSLQLDEN